MLQTMRLSKVAILAIRGMDRDERKRLSDRMGITEDTMYRWMRANDDNFTKAAYLGILREELKLSDAELLEPETAVKKPSRKRLPEQQRKILIQKRLKTAYKL
jgi:hypothetical protein